MRKVTKKQVRSALGDIAGWNFDHYFKDTQKLILFSHANIVKIMERLRAVDVIAIDSRPAETPSTGFIKIAPKDLQIKTEVQSLN